MITEYICHKVDEHTFMGSNSIEIFATLWEMVLLEQDRIFLPKGIYVTRPLKSVGLIAQLTMFKG